MKLSPGDPPPIALVLPPLPPLGPAGVATLPPGFDAGLMMTGLMGYGATAFPFGTTAPTTDPQQGDAGSTQDVGNTQGSGSGQQTNLLKGIMRDPSNVGGGGEKEKSGNKRLHAADEGTPAMAGSYLMTCSPCLLPGSLLYSSFTLPPLPVHQFCQGQCSSGCGG